MQRVERAKQARSIYWHVPPREGSIRQEPRTSRDDNTRGVDQTREAASRTATQAPEAATATSSRRPAGSGHSPLPSSGCTTDQTGPENPKHTLQPNGTEEIDNTNETAAPATPSLTEVLEAAMAQQELIRPDRTDEALSAAVGESLAPAEIRAHNQPEPSAVRTDEMDEAMRQADAWLNDMANVLNDEWLLPPAEVEPSPLTSTATDPRTTSGVYYRSCNCPSHQEVYNNWPAQNAELTIAKCMKICMYCGKDFPKASDLRRHIHQRVKYARRNLTIHYDSLKERGSAEPGWVRRSRRTRPTRQSSAQLSQGQILTNSNDAAPLS